MKIKVFTYDQLDTFIHRLSGLTKLICFLFLTTTVMITYDYRIFLGILVLSLILFKIAKINTSKIKLMLVYVFIFLFANLFISFLFQPNYGTEIFGTSHPIYDFGGIYVLTWEQLFYQGSKFLKYLAVVPLGIVFFLTTNPSEFASSLNKIKVNHKVCTTLSLTLRYFPDVQRDYNTISLAQQARGLNMSSKEKMTKRLANIASILSPLIFSTLDRIGAISNSMELRSYGKYKTRTWYSYKPLGRDDYLSLLFCFTILLFCIYIRVFVNKGLFYNPFI